MKEIPRSFRGISFSPPASSNFTKRFGGVMGFALTFLMTGLSVLGFGAVTADAGFLSAGDLQGSWELLEIQSKPVRVAAGNEPPMFTIKDQSIEGFDGCNRFGGRLDQPGSIFSTQMGCPEGTLMLPLDLTDPMSHLKTGRIEQGRLILPERGGVPSAVFQRME
jgi:heat shock protein HslJ